MIPAEFEKFHQAMCAHHELMQRAAPTKACSENFFRLVSKYLLSDIQRALDAHARRGGFPAKPKDILPTLEEAEAARMRERKAAERAPPPGDPMPSSQELMLGRRMMDELGDARAREVLGNQIVNMLVSDPTLGHHWLDPRAYEDGKVPRHVVDRYRSTVSGMPERYNRRLEELCR